MPIEVHCPNPDCSRVHLVKNKYAGMRGKCPACGSWMFVPSSGQMPSAVGLPRPTLEDAAWKQEALAPAARAEASVPAAQPPASRSLRTALEEPPLPFRHESQNLPARRDPMSGRWGRRRGKTAEEAIQPNRCVLALSWRTVSGRRRGNAVPPRGQGRRHARLRERPGRLECGRDQGRETTLRGRRAGRGGRHRSPGPARRTHQRAVRLPEFVLDVPRRASVGRPAVPRPVRLPRGGCAQTGVRRPRGDAQGRGRARRRLVSAWDVSLVRARWRDSGASLCFLLAAVVMHRRWWSRMLSFLFLAGVTALGAVWIYRAELGIQGMSGMFS